MKQFFLFLLLFAAPFAASSQTQTEKQLTPREFAKVQTMELVNYYKLDAAMQEKIMAINMNCAVKTEALKADVQMAQASPNAISEGIAYNEDLRNSSIEKLLTEKQLDTYKVFRENSVYSKSKSPEKK